MFPTWAPSSGVIAQLVRALPCHGRGRGSSPFIRHHSTKSSLFGCLAFPVTRTARASQTWRRTWSKFGERMLVLICKINKATEVHFRYCFVFYTSYTLAFLPSETTRNFYLSLRRPSLAFCRSHNTFLIKISAE